MADCTCPDLDVPTHYTTCAQYQEAAARSRRRRAREEYRRSVSRYVLLGRKQSRKAKRKIVAAVLLYVLALCLIIAQAVTTF